MKLNIIIIIIILSSYHYFINNPLEKTFFRTYFNYDDIKRPLPNCKIQNRASLYCIGFPSGHAETASVFSFLLYLYGYLPLWASIIIILIASVQRIYTNMHTIIQVTAGSILGLFYALIYRHFNLSFQGFLIVFLIGFILTLLSIYKLEEQIRSNRPKLLYNIYTAYNYRDQ